VFEFFLHFFVNLGGAYGYFRDELYYIACSEHLSWGYVDQPPLSLFILKFFRVMFGDSLVAIRSVPALAVALTMIACANIVKKMDGNLFAITIALVCLLASPIHLAMSSYFSMNSLDMLAWSIAILLVMKINDDANSKTWITLGIVLGLGLLNKISVLFLGAGITVGLIVTNRKVFTTPWPYVAALIALVIFSPYVIWNVTHDFAHLEFIKNASGEKYASRTALDFIKDILLLLNPITIPLWVTGLIALWFYKPMKKYSIIGYLFIIPFLILLFNRTSKGEYLAPAFVIVFAAGAIFFDQKINPRWITKIYFALLIISFVILLPLATPILPVEKYIDYAALLNLKPSSNENKELADLPQFYADMFGWKEKARDVASVYQTLDEDDKKKCAIFSTNYGRCGAIDFFGEQYGLPKSIGNHNSYWIWGPRQYTGEVVIILGGKLSDHQDDFETCQLAATSNCAHCMPYENHVNIFICHGLKKPMGSIWAEEKHYE
jgi:4-amino-4-deoxy-L-arabinose transferase-like glycosyltransferase